MQPIEIRPPLRVQVDVLYALLLREFSARFGRNRSGLLWALIEPLAHVAVPVALFGFIFERHVTGYDYPVFLLYGLLPYFLFRSICMQTMDGVYASRGLLSYRPVHLIDLILAKALFTVLLECGLFIVIAIGLTLIGYELLPFRPVEWMILLAGVSLFGLGLGMMLAALMSFMPDIRAVVKLAFMPLYLISGVVMPINRFPDAVVDILAFNPLLHWIDASRLLGLPHYRPLNQLSWAVIFFSMAVCLCIGLALYRTRRLTRVTP